MEHKVDLTEISDGMMYSINDTVTLGCDGCRYLTEKAKCCHFAEDTITLDPFDIYELSCAGLDFSTLFQQGILALSPVDAVLLPHLNFGKDNVCPFLDESGLCKIHAHRPGLCRLFPLARGFRENSMFYLKQIHECPMQTGTPVTVKDWLGLSDSKEYENFSISWHQLLNDLRTKLSAASDHDAVTALSTRFLTLFYFAPYSAEASFTEQFQARKTAFAQFL